ncbi:MAG: hypothetical protein ACRDNW_14600 [Trebonia sp.]
MTTESPRPAATAGRRPVHASAQDTLPLRVPGTHGPSFGVPQWKPGASPGPETMRRVAAALKRL